MKKTYILSAADQERIRNILSPTTPGPKPSTDQRKMLESILKKSGKAREDEESQSHVGFHDRVSLVSPKDSRDYFNLQIVMPADANPDQDLISVFLPVALAVLGQRSGETVTWEGPRGPREMRIISVAKCEEMAV